MIVNVQIVDQYLSQIDPAVLEHTALTALTHQSASENSELTILVEGDKEIQVLNRDYLGIDASTDVLSFPADEIDPDSGNHYLGDIAISFETALSQSSASGHSVESEIKLLVVHGVLHLLGMDHALPEEKNEMWKQQQAILDVLGVTLSRLPDN
jgi:probable rRNA maturation factor